MKNRNKDTGRFSSPKIMRKHSIIEELSTEYEHIYSSLKDFVKKEMVLAGFSKRDLYTKANLSETILREFLMFIPIKTKVKNFISILDALDVKFYEIELPKSGEELVLGKTDLNEFLNHKETSRLLKRKSCFSSFYWLKNKIIPSNFGNAPLDSLVMFLHFIDSKKVTLDVKFLKEFYTETGLYERNR